VSKGGSAPDGQGEIVVCHEGKGEKRDIVFYGDPTPDMSPLDDEARAISASFEDKWRYKPDTAEVSYSQSMIDSFKHEQEEIASRPQQVEIAGLQELVAMMGQMMVANQELVKTALNQRRLG
jgi:hypothetical protein